MDSKLFLKKKITHLTRLYFHQMILQDLQKKKLFISIMKNRLIILILVLLSFGFSQGNMNAIGLGKFYSNQGVYNAMDGVNTLAPSILKNVNFSNPSTWHNLKFTYLS